MIVEENAGASPQCSCGLFQFDINPCQHQTNCHTVHQETT
ncbi:SWIM zinc finger family protein [Shigella flexneri]